MRRFIEDLKARHGTSCHPFLMTVREGDLTFDAFVESQVQLYFVARAFCVPVLTLAARLATQAGWESLVECVIQPEPADQTLGTPEGLRRRLACLGVTDSALARRAPWPEVLAFNAALLGLCSDADPRLGVAALGVVEDVFGGVADAVGACLIARDWPGASASAHEAEAPPNIARAEAFYARLDWQYARDAGARTVIRSGLETGVYLVVRLLDDLQRGRVCAPPRDRTHTADIARRVREMAAPPDAPLLTDPH